jgi:hypothetical protein
MPGLLAATDRIIKQLSGPSKYRSCRTWMSEPTDTVLPKDGRAIPYPVEPAVSDYAGARTSGREGTLNRNGSDYRTWQGLVE